MQSLDPERCERHSYAVQILLVASFTLAPVIEGATSYAQPNVTLEGRAANRIEPHEVTLDNLETFEAQVRKDLPTGTSRRSVEAYLAAWKFPYSYVERSRTYHANIPNLGRRLIFQASLAVRIRLDPQETVEFIGFRVDYL